MCAKKKKIEIKNIVSVVKVHKKKLKKKLTYEIQTHHWEFYQTKET